MIEIDTSGSKNFSLPRSWAKLFDIQKEQPMTGDTFTSETEALEAIDQEAIDHAIKWLRQHKPQALKAIKYLAEAGWPSDRIIGRIEAKYKDSGPNIQHKVNDHHQRWWLVPNPWKGLRRAAG